MKGKHLAIGLILFVILGSLVIYLTMTATFNKDMNGMESENVVIGDTSWAE